jgi:sigma-70-like protein
MESQEELRPYLFAIAYRMLGSVAEAEDVVQEAFLRLVFYDVGGRPLWVAALEIADGVVVAVRSVLNPDKLAHVPAARGTA